MPLKVSVIAPDLSGGGMTRVYLVSQVLQRLGHDVEVYGCLFGNKIYPTPPTNLPVHAVPGGNLPQFAGTVRQLLGNIQGDIIYAIKPRMTSFGVALLKRVISPRPLLLDIDDWELSWMGGDQGKYKPTPKQFARDILHPRGALRDPQHRLYLEWMEHLTQRADAITVNTQFLKNRYGGHYLPNGKDTDIFNPNHYDSEQSRRKYGLENYRVLMFPGTVRPHKGVEDVLIALDLLNQPDLRLVIVGGRKPDNYEDDLMTRWNRWLIKLPRFSTEQMPEVVAAAHIVVVPQRDLPTANAQFPLKLTDGMAMAKPILTTRVGDIPEIVSDTGFLVDPSSPQQLADTIDYIFSNMEMACQQGNAARKRCVDRYSVTAMADRLNPILSNLKVA